jgi:hypothetical protein
MTLAIKRISGAAAIALLLIIASGAQVGPVQLDRGGEWLSWSSRERAEYVDGFIAGYLQGSHQACEAAEDLFADPKASYRLGDENHASEMPSARCLARTEKYSKAKYREGSGLDLTAYTEVITNFYTNHPEYRGIPFVNLLRLLSDGTNKTAEQIYQMALRGELRPLR